MKPENIKRGKASRSAGVRFESKVRKDLETKGWIVNKWSNNIDNNTLIPAKHAFRGKGIPMTMGTGFPDFMAFRKSIQYYEVIGVESKMNGYLDKKEKEKCKWLLENNIFSKIFIASKKEKGIIYKEPKG